MRGEQRATYQPNPWNMPPSQQVLARTTALFDQIPRQFLIGIVLIIALLAFEIFNFDTTQYALGSLLGDVNFMGLRWATILAIAFCAIDFAGLAHLFTPERGRDEPKAVWYLMGAWFLGATMNALMTWWAVSVTLLGHEFGNEVLGRDQLLLIVPIFVAVLVWLTRILFIGAVSVAGEHLFWADRPAVQPPARTEARVARQPAPAPTPVRAQRAPRRPARPARPAAAFGEAAMPAGGPGQVTSHRLGQAADWVEVERTPVTAVPSRRRSTRQYAPMQARPRR